MKKDSVAAESVSSGHFKWEGKIPDSIKSVLPV